MMPKNQKPKRLSYREAMMLRGMAKGMSAKDAIIAAGYKGARPRQAAYRTLKRLGPRLSAILDKHGLTEEALVRDYLKPALEAKVTKFFAHEGVVTDKRDVVEWSPRITALDLAFKLHGSYPKRDDDSNRVVNFIGIGAGLERSQQTVDASRDLPAESAPGLSRDGKLP